MNDTPLRIRLWADMAMHLDAAQFGLEMDANPTRASVEYVRADLVPQPQEPTDAEVEAAARAICAEQSAFMGEPACWAVKGADGSELPWPNPGCSEPGCHAVARAALIAARKARA